MTHTRRCCCSLKRYVAVCVVLVCWGGYQLGRGGQWLGRVTWRTAIAAQWTSDRWRIPLPAVVVQGADIRTVASHDRRSISYHVCGVQFGSWCSAQLVETAFKISRHKFEQKDFRWPSYCRKVDKGLDQLRDSKQGSPVAFRGICWRWRLQCNRERPSVFELESRWLLLSKWLQLHRATNGLWFIPF